MGNLAECLLVARASILFVFSGVENAFEGTGYIYLLQEIRADKHFSEIHNINIGCAVLSF